MRKTFKLRPVKVKLESLKKPESLEKIIGKQIIRIAPTINGDWSYTDGPVLFEGFSSDNNMIVKDIEEYACFYNEKSRELPICFTDNNWILLEDALKVGDNELNKYIGKKIKRIRPVLLKPFHNRNFLTCEDYKEDCSYMCKDSKIIPPILVSASKYHMVVKYLGKLCIIGPRYSNPKDWVEVK